MGYFEFFVFVYVLEFVFSFVVEFVVGGVVVLWNGVGIVVSICV